MIRRLCCLLDVLGCNVDFKQYDMIRMSAVFGSSCIARDFVGCLHCLDRSFDSQPCSEKRTPAMFVALLQRNLWKTYPDSLGLSELKEI